MLMEMIQKRRESGALRERKEICLSDILEKGWNLMLKMEYLLEAGAQIVHPQ